MAPKGNLFAKAKEKGSSKTEKKNDKLNVVITGAEFDQNLVKIAQLEALIDELTADLDMAKGIVKEVGMEKFEDIYIRTGGYPGSFILSSDSDASIMFVPNDKYIKCDENRAKELIDTYCDDVVTEKTEFVFNPTLLEKYSEVLSDFIETCPDIADDDKYELIQAKTTYNVTKGAIEKAFTWGKGKVSDFVRDIQPVFQLKGVESKQISKFKIIQEN
jgi:hypothetical protein